MNHVILRFFQIKIKSYLLGLLRDAEAALDSEPRLDLDDGIILLALFDGGSDAHDDVVLVNSFSSGLLEFLTIYIDTKQNRIE